MRKSLLTAVLSLALVLLPSTAGAQLLLGVRGGLNLTHMSLNTDDILTNRNGFFIGPSLSFNLPVLGLGFDVSALYDERDARLGDDPLVDIRQKMVSVPVNLRLNFAPESPLSLFVYAGPQFDFNLNKDKKFLDDVRSWKFKESDWSANFGFGVVLLKKLQTSANYNLVCGKTADIISLQNAADVVNDSYKARAKTHAWQFALTVYF